MDRVVRRLHHMHEPDTITNALMSMLVGSEVEDMDRPHIVICRNVASGHATYGGPYPTAMAALTAAEHDHRSENPAGEPMRMEFSVAPLLPG